MTRKPANSTQHSDSVPIEDLLGKLNDVERDLHFDVDKPISADADEASSRGHIAT